MAQSFSRRTFLKYTAATAVAVAGTSLLGGCANGEDLVTSNVGDALTILKVQTTLKSAVYDADAQTATFTLEVSNGRFNALQIDRNNFAVKASDGSYYAYKNSSLSVINSSDAPTFQIKKGATATFTVTAKNVAALPTGTDTLALTFFPDVEYGEYSATWALTEDKFSES